VKSAALVSTIHLNDDAAALGTAAFLARMRRSFRRE
jgi:hypothetical protein